MEIEVFDRNKDPVTGKYYDQLSGFQESDHHAKGGEDHTGG